MPRGKKHVRIVKSFAGIRWPPNVKYFQYAAHPLGLSGRVAWSEPLPITAELAPPDPGRIRVCRADGSDIISEDGNSRYGPMFIDSKNPDAVEAIGFQTWADFLQAKNTDWRRKDREKLKEAEAPPNYASYSQFKRAEMRVPRTELDRWAALCRWLMAQRRAMPEADIPADFQALLSKERYQERQQLGLILWRNIPSSAVSPRSDAGGGWGVAPKWKRRLEELRAEEKLPVEPS